MPESGVRNTNGKRKKTSNKSSSSNTRSQKKQKKNFNPSKAQMIATAISRRCMRINSSSALNINNIILALYNALKLGTSNQDLNKDDYMLLNELLLSQKFSRG